MFFCRGFSEGLPYIKIGMTKRNYIELYYMYSIKFIYSSTSSCATGLVAAAAVLARAALRVLRRSTGRVAAPPHRSSPGDCKQAALGVATGEAL